MPSLHRATIAALPLFQGLQEKDLDRILSCAHAASFPKGTTIFDQDEEATSFCLLLSGHIRVVRTSPDGHQVIARYINEGELFGIAVTMGRPTYPASAVAAVDCVVIAWPNAEWPKLQSLYPTFGASASKAIGMRLLEAQDRVMELSTERVEQRIASTLLRLARQSGRKVADGIQIDFPITRQDIAEMTGSTLHTASRILSAWEGKGFVKSGRQKVIVVDPHELLLIEEGSAGKE